MSDQPTDPSSAAPQPVQPEQPAKPRRKRRTWLMVLGVVLLLIVLLIVFLPSLASTGPAKSFVVNKINASLNGKVEINDWSIGWTSGVDVEGVKVLDQQGVTVLTISRVYVPISLLNAIKGNYALGDVLIERPDLVKFVINEDGSTNYGQLVKANPNDKKPKDPNAESDELPDISGKVTIKELKGSIFRGDGPAVMVIQPSNIVIDVPDLNGPIQNDIMLAFGPNSGAIGRMTLVGQVDAIENRRIAIDTLTAVQELGLSDVELAALAPLLKLAKLDATLAGVGNGAMAVKVSAGKNLIADGQITFTNFALGGPMLNGDTFKTSTLRIPVRAANEMGDIRLKDTGIYFDQGSITISAMAPLAAIQNAAMQKPPGAPGTMKLDVQIPKFAELANQLPNTLKLAEGVQLTQGSVSEVLDVTLTKDATTVASALDVKGVQGTKYGQPLLPLDPIRLSAMGTSFGGQDIRKLALSLASGFATAEGNGETLANLNLTSNIDLRKLREQAGQFTDALDAFESGTAALTLTTSGDLTKENSLIDTKLNVELKDLNIVQPATQPTEQATAMLREPWMRLGVTGGIQRGTSNSIDGVKDLALTLQTNNPQKPTVDVAANANLVMKTVGEVTTVTAPTFTLTKLNVDLPAARDEFRTFLQALDENGLEPTAGRVSLGNPMAGSYDGTTVIINADAPLNLVAANVTMRKTDPATKMQTTPIDDRTVRANVAGAFELGETFAAKLSQFAVVEDRKLFEIGTEGGEFVVRLVPSGAPQGNGSLVMTADLVGLNQALAAFGSPLIEKQPDGSMDLQAGQLGARVKLAANDKQTDIDGALDLNGLTLTTTGEPIQDETIKTVVKLTSAADGSAMNGRANVASTFVKAAVENLQLQLQKQAPSGATTQPSVWEMVRNADVSADVESLSKAYTLYSALSPATQPTIPPGAPPAEAGPAGVESPLVITEGSAKVAMKVVRTGAQTNVDLSEARITNLALVKGSGNFKSPRDMVVNLAASIDAIDAIRQISVTKLTGDLAVATATLTEPLVISNLDTNATAKGSLKVDGKIEDISRLLEALAGQAPGTGYPYAGQLAMTQSVTSSGGPIQLTGKATATDFVVFQQGTQTPAFTEKQLDLTQDVTLDTTARRAAINTLALNMVSSGALKMNVTGGVTGWDGPRKLDEKTRIDLTYDLAKLWPIIKPLIAETPEDYKDLIIAGQASRTFVLGGSYPAVDASGNELPFHEAIKSLTFNGGLTVQKFNYEGLDLTDLDLPLYLVSDGQLVTVYADRPRGKRHPAPAKLNGGTIDLGGFTIDLGHEQPRLSIPKKQQLLLGVSMNPIFADNILGKFLNPSFVDPEQARGLIDVKVGEVSNVPLGDLITGKNDGRAHLIMSIREVNIGNAFLNTLLGKLDVDTRDGALLANIRDAQITIENGILTQDLDFMLEKLTLAFDGKVRLEDQALLPLVMSIPTARLRGLSEDLRKYVPEAITVPITGTTTAPKWNLDVVVRNLVVDAGKKQLLGGALDRALGRDPAAAPAPGTTTQPAPPQREDPLGGLLEGIFNRGREEEKKPAPRTPSEKEPSGSDRISQPKPQ